MSVDYVLEKLIATGRASSECLTELSNGKGDDEHDYERFGVIREDKSESVDSSAESHN